MKARRSVGRRRSRYQDPTESGIGPESLSGTLGGRILLLQIRPASWPKAMQVGPSQRPRQGLMPLLEARWTLLSASTTDHLRASAIPPILPACSVPQLTSHPAQTCQRS